MQTTEPGFKSLVLPETVVNTLVAGLSCTVEVVPVAVRITTFVPLMLSIAPATSGPPARPPAPPPPRPAAPAPGVAPPCAAPTGFAAPAAGAAAAVAFATGALLRP